MNKTLSLLAALALTGCATLPDTVWTFDPTRPQARPQITAADAQPLLQRVGELETRRVEIRNRIAAEPDARNRQPLYAQLHDIGSELSPLQRRLAAYSVAP